MLISHSKILVSDIKNCRILLLNMRSVKPIEMQYGRTKVCLHKPPYLFGSPNSAFPERTGRFIVTEINGSWVTEMDLSGHVYWSIHPPGIAYPSDTNQAGLNELITTDYSYPGQILIFTNTGKVIWRFRRWVKMHYTLRLR